MNYNSNVQNKVDDKTEILENSSLTTAVIGLSGSGKTTLCNLIARFWDVDSSSVKIGGKDVREYTLESLMEQIKTVRNADQILVVDEGRIVQQGKHEDLIGQEGIYADFVLGRKEAIGWKLEA